MPPCSTDRPQVGRRARLRPRRRRRRCSVTSVAVAVARRRTARASAQRLASSTVAARRRDGGQGGRRLGVRVWPQCASRIGAGGVVRGRRGRGARGRVDQRAWTCPEGGGALIVSDGGGSDGAAAANPRARLVASPDPRRGGPVDVVVDARVGRPGVVPSLVGATEATAATQPAPSVTINTVNGGTQAEIRCSHVLRSPDGVIKRRRAARVRERGTRSSAEVDISAANDPEIQYRRRAALCTLVENVDSARRRRVGCSSAQRRRESGGGKRSGRVSVSEGGAVGGLCLERVRLVARARDRA